MSSHHHHEHRKPELLDDGPPADAAVVPGTVAITIQGNTGIPVAGPPPPGGVGIQNISGGQITVRTAQPGILPLVIDNGQVATIKPGSVLGEPTISVSATVKWTTYEYVGPINHPGEARPRREVPVEHEAQMTVQGPRTLGEGDAVPVGATTVFKVTGSGTVALV